MSISLRKRIRQACLLGCVSGAALLVPVVGQASAATYPNGGSTFTGGAEGWTAKAECPPVALTLLCEASVKYDETAGNPSGSLSDQTKITLNLLGTFHSVAVFTSPTFTAGESGAGTLSLERQFENAELLSLAPEVEYTATLVDKTTGAKQKALSDKVEGASPFTGKNGPVALVAGHQYAIEIEATTKSSTVSIGLLGSATFHLDNISLTSSGSGGGGGGGGGGGSGGNGGAGGNGAGGVSSARLESLIRSSSLVGPAILKGNKLSVKAKCPAKVGANCTISLQGLLSRHKPATTTRKAKVQKGKTKSFALTVKPAALSKVRTKSKLLFKETVKAGKAKATVWKALKLVRS